MQRIRLQITDPGRADVAHIVDTVLHRSERVDGASALNDQARLELDRGSRTLILLRALDVPESDVAIGIAVVGNGELDLVIDPEWRGVGYGRAALPFVLGAVPLRTAWSHGNHPAAAALARREGFPIARLLHRMEMRVPPASSDGVGAARASDDDHSDRRNRGDSSSTPSSAEAGHGPLRLRTFADRDAANWVALNADIFRDHAEQGSLTLDDLRSRQATDWYDSDDFLLAEWDGELVGYLWVKRPTESPDRAEIYVVGVGSAYAGRGIAHALFAATFDRLRASGIEWVSLYVDGDNDRAIRLYQRLGFAIVMTETQYSLVRTSTPDEELVTSR